MKPSYEELEQKLAESQREFRAADGTIENLQMKLEKMAAENAGLKQAVIERKNLSEEIRKAGRPPHTDFWHQSIYMADKNVDDALNCTASTDSFLAEVRAQGVEMFAAYCGEENSVFVEAKAYYRSLPDAAYEFAAQLGKGVQP